MRSLLPLLCLLSAAAGAALDELLTTHPQHPPQAALANPAGRLMRQLFQDYAGGPASHPLSQEVHGIPAQLHNGRLSFDLSEVGPVQRAELHFKLRPKTRHRKHVKKTSSKEYLAEAGGSEWLETRELRPLGVWPGDWAVHEASDAVRRWAGATLAVELRHLRRGRAPRLLEAAKALRRRRPFLLVFAKPPPQPASHIRRRRSAGYFSYSRGNGTNHLRAFVRQGPDALQTRKEARRARKARKKERRRKAKANATPKDPTSLVLLGGGGDAVSGAGGCDRVPLEMDWASLGMSEWVIAPRRLELGRCEGGCGGEAGDSLSALSNHARLLGAVRAAGLAPMGGGATCVPRSLDSASILFFNRKGSVVLKNFPDLVLKSCVCQ